MEGTEQEPLGRSKHSGWGIVSLGLSISMWLLFIGFLRLTFWPEGAQHPSEPDSAGAVVVTGSFLLASLGQLVAMLVGLVGLGQKERRRAVAIIGVVLGGLWFVLIAVALASSRAGA